MNDRSRPNGPASETLTTASAPSVAHRSGGTRQLDLLEEGRAARDASLEVVEESTDAWWRDCCDRGIEELARRGHDFQAVDLVDLGVPEPWHPNAWGARLHHAARRGLIEPVGYAQSRRPTVKASVVRVWRGVAA